MGDLFRYIESMENKGNQEICDMVSNVVTDLNKKLPYELKLKQIFQESDDNFYNNERIAEIIGEVKQILLSRLLLSVTEQ